MEYFKNYLKDYISLCCECHKCNNSCLFCMLRGNSRPSASCPWKIPGQPTLDEVKQYIYKLSKSAKHFLFTGAGEITLNNDLIEYVRFAKQYFEHIRIQTNGRKLHDINYCTQLIDAGIDEFYISLAAENAKQHDFIVQSIGAFDETYQGLQHLKDFPVKVFLNITVHKYNFTNLPKLVNLAQQCNIKFIEFCNYWPMAETDRYDLIPKITEVEPYLNKAIVLATDYNIKICLKYFPFCMFPYVNNCQSAIIMDKQFWEYFKKNGWSCSLKNRCNEVNYDGYIEGYSCSGFSKAYIEKYGEETHLLKPIL